MRGLYTTGSIFETKALKAFYLLQLKDTTTFSGFSSLENASRRRQPGVFFYHRRGTRPADEEGHTLTEGESELSPVSSSWKETLDHLPTSTPAARMLPDRRNLGPLRGAKAFLFQHVPPPHTQSKSKKKPKTTFKETGVGFKVILEGTRTLAGKQERRPLKHRLKLSGRP